MVRRIVLVACAAVVVLSAWASPASAGRWLTPDWPAGQEPAFKAEPLFWFSVSECPIVYRTEVEVPVGADRATVLVRSSGYVYLCVDGKQRYGWAPRAEDKQKKIAAEPADPGRVHGVDLSEWLTPGRHVITVSAPRGGFAMDGGIYAGAKRLSLLESGPTWTVAKFAPTTILDDQPIMKVGDKSATAPVKAGDAWAADEDSLAKAYFAAFIGRHRATLDDAAWRLQLLARKGIYIVDDEACGWAGGNRPAAMREAIDARLANITALRQDVEGLSTAGCAGNADLVKLLPKMTTVGGSVTGAMKEVEADSRKLAALDDAKVMTLVQGVPPELRASLSKPPDPAVRTGGPRLNDSRHDRLGWIDHPGLSDSDISRWGVRINPVSGPTTVAGPARWLFSTDPKDAGEKELRHTIGYNIENQWQQIDTRGWAADKRFADCRGVAWYRGRIHIPGEWAGNAVRLVVFAAGDVKLWVNDQEITKPVEAQNERLVYEVPVSVVASGGENFVALRIRADGQRRGLVGMMEASCPALAGEAGKKTPAVDTLSTPLSPCVVLTPRTDTMEIHHGGSGKLLFGGSGEFAAEARDGKGGTGLGNWAMLWLSGESPASALRPILLVFERQPAGITVEGGTTTIKLKEAGSRIIAVRPWAKGKPPAVNDPALEKAVSFWRRAALAVPVNYVTVTQVARKAVDAPISIDSVPPGPVLRQICVYDYVEIKDQWNTQAIKVAPLPALCAYAKANAFRGLEIKDAVQTFQDGGMLAPYQGVENTNRITYSYPIEPYPRLIGFTCFAFSGSDAGVPGNKRELELMAAAGANSFRPQHNFSDELPPRGFYPAEDKRTRVQVTADYCSAIGVNYMNNIDQTLGGSQQVVRDDYDGFMAKVNAHYEKIARQLDDRPFSAVAYDLINEPFDHQAAKYNPAMKELTRRVRAIDKTHLLYVEPCQSWGAIQQIALVEPTGDPLTVYSFHDYNFRLDKPSDRWPTLQRDMRSIYQLWMPAIQFQLQHGVCLHCGEFGGFGAATADSPAQMVLLNDFFRVFDQFGMHHHYYSGREVYIRQADGSLRPSNVVRAYRRYLARGDVNMYWDKQP